MNNSSQEQPFTITLNDETTYTIDDITWNWDSSTIPTLTTSDVITLTSPTSSTVSIDSISIDSFTGWYKEEFDGKFPDYDRVQEMCKEYPGLDIAYKKFKEVYTMVKEDYDGKERERRGLK